MCYVGFSHLVGRMPSHILFFPEACLELPCSNDLETLQALHPRLWKNLPCSWFQIVVVLHHPWNDSKNFQLYNFATTTQSSTDLQDRMAHLWGSMWLVWDKWFKDGCLIRFDVLQCMCRWVWSVERCSISNQLLCNRATGRSKRPDGQVSL